MSWYLARSDLLKALRRSSFRSCSFQKQVKVKLRPGSTMTVEALFVRVDDRSNSRRGDRSLVSLSCRTVGWLPPTAMCDRGYRRCVATSAMTSCCIRLGGSDSPPLVTSIGHSRQQKTSNAGLKADGEVTSDVATRSIPERDSKSKFALVPRKN